MPVLAQAQTARPALPLRIIGAYMNLGELKQSEEYLRKSQALLKESKF